ncbi:hypothetical protein [Prevotella amnii]|uniref:hypothetical protein n=1 Tax=Prevotella amnii TaxID=419005 RepID=UPI000361F23F|nr:hypothetical protein [Prevotella amnii]
MARKNKFTKSLPFRIICIIAIILFLGIAYNFIVDIGKKSNITEEDTQTEMQDKVSHDTIDIVGDYLWSNSKKKSKSETTNASSTTDGDINNRVKQADNKNKKKDSDHKDPLPLPAPEIGPVPEVPQSSTITPSKAESSSKQSVPTKPTTKIEKTEPTKINKID